MKFLLHISAAPNSPFATFALRFAETLVAQKHETPGLFFSGDAVSIFNSQDCSNPELLRSWQRLLEKVSATALCCSAASAKHLQKNTLPSYVEIVGLGQLIDESTRADKVVCFGSRN